MPPDIKLLAIDKENKSFDREELAGKDKDLIALEEDEIVIDDDKVPKTILGIGDNDTNIESWFQYGNFLGESGKGDSKLSKGAGQYRPIGRIALFHNSSLS